jgi:hypothetical protein
MTRRTNRDHSLASCRIEARNADTYAFPPRRAPAGPTAGHALAVTLSCSANWVLYRSA